MQAADLLALIVPAASGAAPQGGAPGLASGKGAAGQSEGLGKGVGQADAGPGADAANPFAQALAALMAAPGLNAAPTQPPATPAEEGASAETAPADQPTLNKGLQTALAATEAAGAQAKGLAKLLGAQSQTAQGAAQVTQDTGAPAPQPAATPASADAEPAEPIAPTVAAETAAPVAPAAAETETPVDPQAAGAAPKPLPDQAKADEALARRQETPSLRSDRAGEVAKGPQLPAWARTPAPTQTAQQPAPVAPPPVETPVEAATPAPAPPTADPSATTTDPAALSLAGGQVQPKADEPTPKAADGKALAKGKPAEDEDTPAVHTPKGLAKGWETAPGQVKKASGEDSQSKTPPSDTQPQTAAADAPADNTSLAGADQVRANTLSQVHADKAAAAAHTVAHLAEAIVSKADGKSTRFDVQLDPAGLGKVDVKIEIDRQGQIQAALTFDNPQAAAELRSRAGELRTALEQAGFDLSKGGLSFDFSGQGRGQNLWDQQAQSRTPAWSHASFTDLSTFADPPGAARRRTIDAGGVDVTV